MSKKDKSIVDQPEPVAHVDQRDEAGRLVRTMPSSKPGRYYELREGADGVVYCNCPGWAFSKLRPRECKHMRAFAAEVAEGGKKLFR